MYKIKLLNKISSSGLERFKQSKQAYECGENVDSPDAIIVRSASMHDMEIPESTVAIARAGAGYNNIPVDKCTEKGICVFNTPGANANAVKELTIAGLLMSARRIYPSMNWVQGLKGQGDAVAGLAEKGKGDFVGPELRGKTLGVIGLGAIGNLISNAAVHLGMEVYGYDPYVSVDAAWNLSRSVKHARTLSEIYEKSDYITIHVPSTKETKGFINASAIKQMKDGVRIMNFSRADLVNTADILAAVDSKKVFCYVTDFALDELLGNPGVLVMPHLGASTPESEIVCAEMAADQIRDFLENGNIVNSVNLPNIAMPRSSKFRVGILHHNQPGIIGQITKTVGENINNMTNNSRGNISYSLIDLDSQLSGGRVKELKEIDGIIRIIVCS